MKGTTFADVAHLYIESHKTGWRSRHHEQQWRGSLRDHVLPRLGDKPVADITTDDILLVLQAIWTKLPDTASRIRSRIELVLDYAKARSMRDNENPARWRGHLAAMLPATRRIRTVKHHPALPYQEVPALMTLLAAQPSVAALALRLLILTTTRRDEVRQAKRGEFDLKAATWTIPPERMKANRQHRIPLSPPALAIVSQQVALSGQDGDLLFGYVGFNAMLFLMPKGYTTHGLRSSFRDWAAETGQPSDIAEVALAHHVGPAVERAYQRSDLLVRRRTLMDEWATFCTLSEHRSGVV